LPPSSSRTAPPSGALGLAAGQAAAPGGAGHRRGSGAGHSPGEEKEEEGAVAPSTEKGRGLCPPPTEEKRGGLLPPSTADAQGAQVGPLAGHGRRPAAGGAHARGGAGHPKR